MQSHSVNASHQQTSINSNNTNANSSCLTSFICCNRRRLFYNLVLASFLGLVGFVTFSHRQSTDIDAAATLSASSANVSNDVIVSADSRLQHNFRFVNRVITDYDSDVAERLRTLVDRRATSADTDLIRLIQDMMDPPSRHMVKMSRQLFETPQSKEAEKILNHKVDYRRDFIFTLIVCTSNNSRHALYSVQQIVN